jgi:DNA-binding response OmpR family regulator
MSLLQTWLEQKNYTVKFTGNAAEVSQLIKTFEPKLLIVDILQKDILKQLKSNGHASDFAILLMTGYSYRQKTEDLPVDDVIEKPFNLSVLEKKIEIDFIMFRIRFSDPGRLHGVDKISGAQHTVARSFVTFFALKQRK